VDNPKLCPRADSCVTRDIWSEVKDAVNGVLESTTLQNLIEREEKKKKNLKQEMYYI
jgi:DNA-binding IscR family transcriptional regulator